MDMKPIDRFNRFMGRATIDAAELLVIALKDVLDLISVIQTIFLLTIRSISSFRKEFKNQIAEQRDGDRRLSEIVFLQLKKLIGFLIDLNKKILINVFYSAANKQPLIPLVFIVGSIAWIWLAFETQNFLMGVIGLIPMFMIFTCPAGLWYLIFG